jgi:hypothetical protein
MVFFQLPHCIVLRYRSHMMQGYCVIQSIANVALFGSSSRVEKQIFRGFFYL